MRVVLGVVLVGVLLLSSLPWHSSPSDSPVRPNLDGGRPSPTAGTFVGWRDDFNDRLKVGSYSNLVLSAGVVRLPSPDPNNLTRQGLVLGRGAPADFDSAELGGPTVVLDQGTYKMWYFGDNGGGTSIGYATSTNGVAWTKQGVALAPSLPQDSLYAAYPEVLKVGGGFVMWYSGFDGSNYRILHATSADGVTWTKQGVVLDVGAPGSMDDWYVWAPSLLVQGGTYSMWYVGQRSTTAPGIFLATSSDGISWTKQGRVLAPGAPGSIDESGIIEPAVRLVASRFEMIYSAIYPGGARLARADSSDGVSWTKLGYMLDLLSPDESSILAGPFLHVEADSSWKVYYHARGSSLQIFLAIRPAIGPLTGWLRSVPVPIPSGIDWTGFNHTALVPGGTWLNVSVRDAATLSPLPGLENLTWGAVDLTSVDSTSHPALVFEGWLTGNGSVTPVLDSWESVWTDRLPPTFGGIQAALDLGTGGAVRLSWAAASDPSPPVTYSVYVARGTTPFNFAAANFSTSSLSQDVIGLTDGTSYRFAVRATDRWGNQDSNLAERTSVPTTPLDATPPLFGGLVVAVDGVVGGTVILGWLPATDPDTAASNSDPSLPIQYRGFVTRTGTAFDFGTPAVVTGNLTAIVTGLTDGVSYDFLVRAADSKGNGESNMVVLSATPTHAYDSTPPVFQGVDTAVDSGSGDRVSITWLTATDPDTPESSVDPSLPIRYSIWISENSSGLGTGTPRATTNATSIEVGGLRPGVTYYVLVRATDSAGNSDTNLHTISFQLRQPVSLLSYWWIALVIALVLIIVAFVAWRRRRKPAAAPPPPPGQGGS